MMHSTIAEKMSAGHQHCDDLFAAAESSVGQGEWGEARADFSSFNQVMEHHLRMEEEILFPEFEARTGQQGGPTEIMRGEHAQMRDLFLSMSEAVGESDQSGYLGSSETLLWIIQQHNSKEENILYPMIDNMLSSEVDLLLQKLSQLD
ncbi:MAG: hemerythrin domain-containing protein [Arenicellales bacterium]|jgi:hemerythrin-like domain-containing protein|nr:hemerythrin domain-containing protein [Arenicellales bacterium]MDP6671765.1 hemerythrin domain-containing protein [Arenicellales bacterium]MDP6723901.1 hemerythrin domain-containing protein [Arenicellales bacterium]|tara:strand:+ start:38506 stop:38949 length:444 start_codon:yes stop_codon:yes gene_type:complete